MSQVVSFQGYRPPARFDDEPWTTARVQEADAATGPWVTIDDLALDPVDADPADPASRDFTTDEASDDLALWYRAIFLDAGANQSQPTDPVQNLPSTPYVTRDELKELLALEQTEFRDSAIDVAVETASRACDGYKSARFYPLAETRYYTASPFDSELQIDDLSALDSLSVDEDGDGTHETTWTRGTDFLLDPANAELGGQPYNTVTLRDAGGRAFPAVQRGVKLVGTFGWASTPALVKEATVLLANRLLVRTTQAPLGILVATANEMVATARLGRIDPDAAFLLDQLPSRFSRSGLTSLRLG